MARKSPAKRNGMRKMMGKYAEAEEEDKKLHKTVNKAMKKVAKHEATEEED